MKSDWRRSHNRMGERRDTRIIPFVRVSTANDGEA
jgi:hypothetical protein